MGHSFPIHGPSLIRHPELVSGSILPRARRKEERNPPRRYPSIRSTALQARWILKQVQDDELWLGKGTNQWPA
jgi:hypothetical protein